MRTPSETAAYMARTYKSLDAARVAASDHMASYVGPPNYVGRSYWRAVFAELTQMKEANAEVTS